jgi:hypothetical protein
MHHPMTMRSRRSGRGGRRRRADPQTRRPACCCWSLVRLNNSSFGLHWDNVIKCLYCIDHSRLIPGDDFHSHFGSSFHPKMFAGTTRYVFLTASAFHLADCYPEIRNQSCDILKASLPTMLQEPIVLKEGDASALRLRYKCPYETCDVWIALKHLPKVRAAATCAKITWQEPREPLSTCFPMVDPARWFGKGFNASDSTHYFVFSDTFKPPAEGMAKPVFPTVNLTAPSTDTWPALLGWESYIDKLSLKFGLHQKAADKLRDLVMPPNADRISASSDLLKMLEASISPASST